MIDAIKEAVVGLDFKCWLDALKDFIKTNSYQITITAGVVLGIVVLTALVCVLVHKSKRIGIVYSCPEGNFSAKGNTKRFVVKKGRRFSFVVENGEIVAFRDRKASRNTIPYAMRGDQGDGQIS